MPIIPPFPLHSRFQRRPTSVLSGLYVRSHPALCPHRRRRRRPSGSHRRAPDTRRVHRRAGAHGADALDRLKGFAYDGLVIDLKLPDADGLDILNAAMTRYPEVVAVVMTGLRRCRRSGRGHQARRHRLLHQAGATGPAVARAGRGHQRTATAPGERRTARPAARSLPVRQRHRAEHGRCSRCSRAWSWWRR